ncbi:MAG: hypothetical protein JSV88_01615 [Candidatus Aminicenantes bacterium]|nr:MAG: hypothetical protein JSV88_01615 [Candidatus Aminicenantes bacterium]
MKKQEPLHQQQKTMESETTISRLLNSIYYFLDCVFIILSEGDYRLVILHHDKVIMDAHYNTLRGAKIAFAKFFREMAWAEDVQPQWSHLYHPELDWLDEKLAILNRVPPRERMDY